MKFLEIAINDDWLGATFCPFRKPVPRGLVGELYVGGVRKSTAGAGGRDAATVGRESSERWVSKFLQKILSETGWGGEVWK